MFESIIILLLAYLIYRMTLGWKPKLPDMFNKNDYFYYGHRGLPSLAPENTLLSFQIAIDHKMDGIEVDVHRTKDGVIIIYHDPNLEDITGDDTPISELTYEFIGSIDVKRACGDIPFQHIPRLIEVLDIIPMGMGINIEIKFKQFGLSGLESEIVKIVRDRDLINQVVISSFNPFVIWKIKYLNKKISTAFLWQNIPFTSQYWVYLCRPDAFHVDINIVDSELVNWVRKRNLPIYAYTVNSESQIQKVKKLGLDGIFTDHPKLK